MPLDILLQIEGGSKLFHLKECRLSQCHTDSMEAETFDLSGCGWYCAALLTALPTSRKILSIQE